MAKIFDNINADIMSAMKEKNAMKTTAYKNLKAKMLEFKTAAKAKPLDDAAEISIIKKMVTELKNDAQLFDTNNRPDLSKPALEEAAYLEEFLPEMATEEDILKVMDKYDKPIEKKQMGIVIKEIKATLPNADGKLVSDIVKRFIV